MTHRPNSGLLEWRSFEDQFIPLSVVAAITFHQVQRGTKAIKSPRDYLEALNLAASALSRLIPIYVMDEASKTRVAINVDLLDGEFAGAATEFRYRNGGTLKALYIRRGDFNTAIAFMRRASPTLGLAISAALEASVEAQETRHREE